MSPMRLCLLPLIAGLSACAHQAVGEPQAATVATVSSYVGFAVESLPQKAVAEYMAGTLNALNKTLAESEAQQWRVTQLADGSIRMQTTAGLGFEADSAELRPSALQGLARIAEVARIFNKTTVHVLANGRDARLATFSQSLSDRRAAALATYLNGQGVAETRTRYEGLAKAPSAILQIVIRPVVTGTEAQAWMPPS